MLLAGNSLPVTDAGLQNDREDLFNSFLVHLKGM